MKTLEELKQIRECARHKMALRLGERRATVKVGMGDAGLAAGARATLKAFCTALDAAGVTDVAVVPDGRCCAAAEEAPVVVVELAGAEPVKYGKVDADLAAVIVKEHILGGNTVESALLK